MAETVKVRLRKPGRVFTFITRNVPLERNDNCIVRSDRGLEYGICVLPPEECPPQEEKRYKMSVVRRATHHDDTTYGQIKIDEARAKTMCRDKIRERDLPMKLVECEYAFDRKKIIFYFTAEDRVDFRELVRDLAQDLKARIELRHIQVRDEAKIVGGIGTCGRELCCTTWMREFVPISMRMAKQQNLSLNPSKISGQCGRLMCCLSYENDQYAKVKRAAKKKPPADPAEIRNRMEAEPAEAAKVLKESTLKDATPESEAVEHSPSPQAEKAPQETTDTEAKTGQEKTSENADRKPAEGGTGRRRKRRRGRGGRGNQGNKTS